MKGGKRIPALRLTPTWLRVPQRLHQEVGKEVSSSQGSPLLSIAPVPPSPLLADAAAARGKGGGGKHPPIAMDTGVPTGGSARLEPEQFCSPPALQMWSPGCSGSLDSHCVTPGSVGQGKSRSHMLPCVVVGIPQPLGGTPQHASSWRRMQGKLSLLHSSAWELKVLLIPHSTML